LPGTRNTASRWNRLANDYAILAEELDAHSAPILRPPLRQPIQQQQSKTNN